MSFRSIIFAQCACIVHYTTLKVIGKIHHEHQKNSSCVHEMINIDLWGACEEKKLNFFLIFLFYYYLNIYFRIAGVYPKVELQSQSHMIPTYVFNREQLIAGAVLGEVFFFSFCTLVIALKLCIMHDILYNKSCQNRFLKFTQCSAVLRIC